jgi:hypothetical protein
MNNVPVGRLNQPSAGAFGIEQHFQILEPALVARQARTRDEKHAGAARERGLIGAVGQHGVGQIDRAIRREAAIGPHLEETLPRPQVGRQTFERLRHVAVFRNDLDSARPLADEDPAVGKKAETERAGESLRHRLDDEGGGVCGARCARLTEPRWRRRIAVGRRAAVFGRGGPGACAGGRGTGGTRWATCDGRKRERDRGVRIERVIVIDDS